MCINPILATLTPRQREILTLIMAGHSNKVIAGKLGLSRRTIEGHRAALMKKLGAKTAVVLGTIAASLEAEQQ